MSESFLSLHRCLATTRIPHRVASTEKDTEIYLQTFRRSNALHRDQGFTVGTDGFPGFLYIFPVDDLSVCLKFVVAVLRAFSRLRVFYVDFRIDPIRWHMPHRKN